MKHIELLGEQLKSDFLCDLFETYDVEVAYEYDRDHEGMADAYRASIPDLGLEFAFDDSQTLRTLFTTPVEITTFCPLDGFTECSSIFESKEQAVQYAHDHSIVTKVGNAEFMGEECDWILFELPEYSIHYNFRSPRLFLITLQLKSG